MGWYPATQIFSFSRKCIKSGMGAGRDRPNCDFPLIQKIFT